MKACFQRLGKCWNVMSEALVAPKVDQFTRLSAGNLERFLNQEEVTFLCIDPLESRGIAYST
jgi:hypothetical protein